MQAVLKWTDSSFTKDIFFKAGFNSKARPTDIVV